MRQIHKLLAVIIAIMACVLVCPASAWADTDVCPNSENGEHEWVYYNSADCVYEGTGSWQCIYCYKERDIEVTPPLGHDYIAEETTPATCEASGVMTYTCTRCGDSYRETIPATGHVWDNGTVTREPGCEEPGEIIYTCVVCGGTIINSIPPFYHDFSGEGVITKEADCLSTGIIAYTCKNCGEVYEETIPIGSHNWDAGTVTQPATCTENGVYTYTCTVCGTTRTETIAAYGHTPVTVAGWPATCTASGMTEGSSCSVCGAVLTAQTEIPATGHNWDAGKVTQEATCTENGVYTYTCHNCPKTWSESIPATGHSWNNGMVTREPKGFDPGIKTYTCLYCGETRGESISPTKGLFSKLRNNTLPAGMGPDPLTIVQQPLGGAVSLGTGSPYPHSIILTVEAAGGVEPYTYEWHFRHTNVDEAMDAGTISGMISASQEILDEVVEGYQNAKENWAGVWSDLYEKIHGEKPETASPGEGTGATEAEMLLWDVLNVNDNAFSTGYGPAFEGHGGNTYYCVVTDATGKKTVSDPAEVRYAISIESTYANPNKNYALGEDTLTCNDIHGTEPITYHWYLDDGSAEGVPMDEMSGKTAQVPYPGNYYCIAEDASGDTARTETAVVYEADEFRIAGTGKSADIREGEEAILSVYIEGGVKPYSVNCWYVDADWNQEDLGYLEGSLEGEDSPCPGSTLYKVYTQDPGTFWFYISDAAGNELETQIEIKYRQLKISKQPEGGVLSLNGQHYMKVEMAEGTEPFTYEIYRIPLGWEKDGFDTGELFSSSESPSIVITEPDTYYFIIHDAEGRWARSDYAVVKPYEVNITISGSPQISVAGSYTELDVSVSGGEGPYTYQWEKYENSLYEYVDIQPDDPDALIKNNGKRLRIKKPGWYSCTVTDVNGVPAAQSVNVVYIGKDPLIMKEPEDALLPAVSLSFQSATLTCEAVSGSGDDSVLTYDWQKKGENGWSTVYSGKEYDLQEDGTVEGQISGFYRCEVTDTQTGRSKVSTEAFVRLELECVRAEQLDTSTVVFEFAGGKAPYQVRSDLCSFYDEGAIERYWSDNRQTITDPDDLNFTFDDVNTYTRFSTAEEYYFHVHVEDAVGQECDKVIPFKWY